MIVALLPGADPGLRTRLLRLLTGVLGLAALMYALAVVGGWGGPIGLALVATTGGYALSGRGPRWTRIVAGIVGLSGIAGTFLAPKPYPYLSYTTPQGAWFDTLAASLGVVLTLACSIPMRRADTGRAGSRCGRSGHLGRPADAGQVRRRPGPLALGLSLAFRTSPPKVRFHGSSNRRRLHLRRAGRARHREQ